MVKAILILAIMLLACGSNDPVAQSPGPNIILIIIDTLRADHVHCYGYDRAITPTLDSLAGAGSMWAFVQGQAAWTLPAMATIYSGLPERGHLAGFREGVLYGLDERLYVLPEIFSDAGYATSGFYNVPVLEPQYGFDQGMDHLDLEGCRLAVDADVINDKFLAWLDNQYDRSSPFFSVLHYFDPHYPYDPPEPYDAIFATDDSHPSTHWATEPTELLLRANSAGRLTEEDMGRMIDLYDGEIAFADAEVGRLLRELRQRGLADNTLVVIVADHGEEFREHGGLLHGFTLHREATRVPLIISGPGFEGGGIDSTVVSQMDLFATLVLYAGMDQPDYSWGEDLRSSIAFDRVIPASGFASDVESYLTVRRDSLRLFWDYEQDSSVLFDLKIDPLEQDSLPTDSAMLDAAAVYWATPAEVRPSEVPGSQSRVNRLRNLGYCR